METVSPEEFIEKPVIDIEVEFIGAPGFAVRLNDTEHVQLSEVSPWLEFTVHEESKRMRMPMRNIAFYSIRRLIDRIPKNSLMGKAELLER